MESIDTLPNSLLRAPEELLDIDVPARLEYLRVDLRVALRVVELLAPGRQLAQLDLVEVSLEEPLHRVGREDEELRHARRDRGALEEAEQGVARALPPVLRRDYEAAELGRGLRVSPEHRHAQDGRVAREDIEEARVHLARERSARSLHQHALEGIRIL